MTVSYSNFVARMICSTASNKSSFCLKKDELLANCFYRKDIKNECAVGRTSGEL